MVAITTYKNTLKNKSTKKTNEYCFRSTVDQTLTAEQLIQEIIRYNSTITEADARAVLSVLNDRVKHFVSLGYEVELPFAFLHLKANGTVARLNGGFTPGAGDNRFEVVCTFKEDAAKEMTDTTAYRIAGTGWTVLPKITELLSVSKVGKESSSLFFETSDMMRIKGKYLKFDANNEKQGVFFVAQDGKETPAERYNSIGTCITEVYIPASLASGLYKIKIVTSPRKYCLEEFTSSSSIEVLSE